MPAAAGLAALKRPAQRWQLGHRGAERGELGRHQLDHPTDTLSAINTATQCGVARQALTAVYLARAVRMIGYIGAERVNFSVRSSGSSDRPSSLQLQRAATCSGPQTQITPVRLRSECSVTRPPAGPGRHGTFIRSGLMTGDSSALSRQPGAASESINTKGKYHGCRGRYSQLEVVQGCSFVTTTNPRQGTICAYHERNVRIRKL